MPSKLETLKEKLKLEKEKDKKVKLRIKIREEKKRLKKKEKRDKKRGLKELDNIWKKRVKERDKYNCLVCRKKVEGHNCHAHHILPKSFKRLRWDIENGITLCYHHHKIGKYSAHLNALWFTFWLKTNRNKQFRYIIKKIEEIGRREQ